MLTDYLGIDVRDDDDNNQPAVATTDRASSSTTIEHSNAEAEQPESGTLRKSLGGLRGAFEENTAIVIRSDHSRLVAEQYRVIPLDLEPAPSDRRSTATADGSGSGPYCRWTTSNAQHSSPRPPKAKGSKALLIGINSRNASPKEMALEYAVADAKRFHRCLIGPLGFKEEDVEAVTDEMDQAREGSLRADIGRKMDWLFKNASKDDMLVLFGHCRVFDGNRAVLLVSFDGGSESHALFPSSLFQSYFSQLPAGCTVEIIVDCCYGAGLIRLPEIQRVELKEASMTTGGSLSSNASAIEGSITSQSRILAPGKPRGGICYTITQLICPARGEDAEGFEDHQTEPTRNEWHTSQPIVALPNEPTGQINRPRLFVTPCQGSNGKSAGHETYDTDATVTVWVAAGSDQKAYELSQVAGGQGGGILSSAICKVIEEHNGYVERRIIWDEVCRITQLENIRHGINQQPRMLSSQGSTLLLRCPRRRTGKSLVRSAQTSAYVTLLANSAVDYCPPTLGIKKSLSGLSCAKILSPFSVGGNTPTPHPGDGIVADKNAEEYQPAIPGCGQVIGPDANELQRKTVPSRVGLSKGSANTGTKSPPTSSGPSANENVLNQHARASESHVNYGSWQARPPRNPTSKALLLTADSAPSLGINHQLGYTANDSERFKACLREIGFEEIRVVKAIGFEYLSRSAVMEGLDFLLSGAVDDDMLVVLGP
ncbi:Ca(2+)-dependent cysteine protease [Ceratobasidium sp. 395]|nr:Ca(2+)-dependent cysteine protease [Ceratobasidium sp. 395]